MSSQGPYYPSSASVVDYNSSTDWENVSNIFNSDGSLTAVNMNTIFGSNYFSDYLYGTNYGFSIPAGATIDGVVGDVKCKDNFSPHAVEYLRQLTKNGSTLVGSNQTAGQTLTASLVVYSCGSSSNLWGTTLSQSEVNATTFGQVVQFTGNTSSGARVFVDDMRMTVYYTAASGQPTQRRFSQMQRGRSSTTELGREGVYLG